jgi:hypothetical protein
LKAKPIENTTTVKVDAVIARDLFRACVDKYEAIPEDDAVERARWKQRALRMKDAIRQTTRCRSMGCNEYARTETPTDLDTGWRTGYCADCGDDIQCRINEAQEILERLQYDHDYEADIVEPTQDA